MYADGEAMLLAHANDTTWRTHRSHPMTPLLPLLPPDHRQARGAKQLGAARADVIALSLAVLQFVGHEVVVADAAAGAVRQAGDGAVTLEDAAQIVDERAHFPAN